MDRQPNEENKLYLKLMEFAELRAKKYRDPFLTFTSSEKKKLDVDQWAKLIFVVSVTIRRIILF